MRDATRRLSLTEDGVLNLARLEEAYDNDVSAIANLLALARQTELGSIRALREAIARNDLLGVARAAHSIKGSASNIGAGRVSSVAARIEDQARLSVWDGIAEFADELDRAFSELGTEIAAYGAKIA